MTLLYVLDHISLRMVRFEKLKNWLIAGNKEQIFTCMKISWIWWFREICEHFMNANISYSTIIVYFFYLRRPSSDMNIASGFPKFCKLSELDCDYSHYIVDDTMFIRMIVDPQGENPRRINTPYIIKEPSLIRWVYSLGWALYNQISPIVHPVHTWLILNVIFCSMMWYMQITINLC